MVQLVKQLYSSPLYLTWRKAISTVTYGSFHLWSILTPFGKIKVRWMRRHREGNLCGDSKMSLKGLNHWRNKECDVRRSYKSSFQTELLVFWSSPVPEKIPSVNVPFHIFIEQAIIGNSSKLDQIKIVTAPSFVFSSWGPSKLQQLEAVLCAVVFAYIRLNLT